MKVEKSRPWKGEGVIPTEGGTVVWKPTINKDKFVIPSIEWVYLCSRDSNEKVISSTQSTYQDITFQKIKGDGYEKFSGEGYGIITSTNVVLITLSPNDTPFERVIGVDIADGPYTGAGFHSISVSQLPKSWSKK